jgi:WD40 repeat protein
VIAAGTFGVALFNSADGVLIRKLTVAEAIHGVAFSPEGSRIAAAGRDKVVRIWNTATGELVRTIEPQGFMQFVGDQTFVEPIAVPILAVDFAPDGKSLATAGSDRMVRIWDLESGKERQRFEGHRASITAVRFLDEKRLVSGSLDGTVKFWTLK